MGFDPTKAVVLVGGLPPRQREILVELGRCRSHKEIADDLAIRETTVRAHCRFLFARLGIRSTAEAVRVAVAAKLV